MSAPWSQSFGDPGLSGQVSRSVTVDLNADVSGFTQGMQQATAQAQALAAAMGQAAQHADSLSKRAGKTLMHFAVGDFASLGAAVGVAARFEHQLSTMNATAAITGTNMDRLKQGLSGVFTQFPVWREQIVQLATAIGNMGVVRAPDITRLTASYTKLGAATGEDSTSLAASGISLAKQMGNLDASRIDKYNNSLVTLAKTAGVSAQSITDFASALAPFAKQAGIGEAAVMGISAAFQKAGADGQVAANVFSSLLSTITQLKQSGGDVSKYSGFLGVSQQQFRGMSPLQAASQLFQQIGQGGPRAAYFTQDLGGIRAQQAVQRISQSGDMQAFINQSQANATGTGNLDKSSQAAFSGLTNSMTDLRNQFTEMAQLIGDPLLKPLTMLADVLGKVVSGFTNFMKMLGPLPAIAGTAAGAMAVPAAFGLAHAGVLGALGTARWAFGRNAGWRSAIGAGRSVEAEIAASMKGGMSRVDAEALAMQNNPIGARFLAGKLPPHMAASFDWGRQLGPAASTAGAASSWFWGTRMGQAIWNNAPGPGGVPRGAPGGTGGPPPPRPGTPGGPAGFRGFVSPAMAYAAAGGRWLVNQQNLPQEEAGKAWWKREGVREAAGEQVVRDSLGRGLVRAPFLLSSGGLKAAGAGMREVSAALPWSVGGTLAKGGLQVAGGLATGAGFAAQGLGMAAGALTSGPGMMIAMLAVPLVQALASWVKSKAPHPEDIKEAESGAQFYDQMLDKTSSNLAKLGDSADSAAAKLSKLGEIPGSKTPAAGAADVSAIQSPDFKPDVRLQTVMSQSKGSPAAITAYLNTLAAQEPNMTADRAAAIQQQVLYGYKGDITKTNLVTTPWFKNLGQPGGAAVGQNFDVLGGLASGQSNNEQYKNIVANAYPALVAAANVPGAPAAATKQLPSQLVRLAAMSTGKPGFNQGQQVESAAASLAEWTGLKKEDIEKEIWLQGQKLGTQKQDISYQEGTQAMGARPFSTAAEAEKVYSAVIANVPGGKEYLSSHNITAAQLLAGAQKPQGILAPTPATDIDLANLRKAGGFGRILAGTGAVQALTTQSQQPGAQQAAMGAMLAQAMKAVGPGPMQAQQASQLLLRTTADSTGPIKDLANAASQAADQLADIAKVNLSPLQSAIATISSAQATIAAGTAPGASAEEAAKVPGAVIQKAQGVADLTTQAHQRIQAVRDFGIQQARAYEDYQTSIRQSNLAYNNQMADQTLSYTRQRSRTERDFQINQDRSDYQHKIQVQRSERDFQISQNRNTYQYQLSRTREIRDADKQQARAQEDFNTSRSRQLRDFDKSRSRSIRDFDKQEARAREDYNTSRQREETQYQLDRSRSIEDFNTSQLRAQEDFHTQQSRQIEHFHINQARQERDYYKSRNRAQEDFNIQMERQAEKAAQAIYNPMQRIQRQATVGAGGMLRNLSRQNAALEKQLKNLDKAKALGVSIQTIQTLDLANPANAQELDALIKSMQRNPNTIGQINNQVATRVKDTKALTQNIGNLDYAGQLADFQKTQQRAWEDYNQSVKDATADLALSLKEQYADFVKETRRAQKDQAKNLSRSEHDHKVAMENEAKDFRKTTLRESADFRTSLKDQWTDLQTSLRDGEADFKKTSKRAKDDLKTSLHDQAVDFSTQMKNAVDDFHRSMSDQQADFLTARKNAKADEVRTLSDMQTDFSTAQSQAARDHGIAMSQMEDQYNRTLKRAGEDLKTSFTSVTGNLNQSLITMANQAKGQLAEYGPQAVQDYINWINTAAQAVGNAAAQVSQPAAGGVNWGQPGGSTTVAGAQGADTKNYNPQTGAWDGSGHSPSHAAGGITVAQHLAMIGEAGHELVLPLNKTGEKFLGSLMSTALGDATKDVSVRSGGGVLNQFGEGDQFLARNRAQKEQEAAQKAKEEAAKRAREQLAKEKYLENERRRKEMEELAKKKEIDAKHRAEEAKRKAEAVHRQQEQERKHHDDMERARKANEAKKAAEDKKKAEDAKHKAAAQHPASHPAGHPAGHPAAAHPAGHPAAQAAAVAQAQQFANILVKSLASVIVPALKVEENLLRQLVQKNDNQVSFSGAQIKVVASDPNKMAAELQKQAKLKRLVSPLKH